MSLYAFLVVLCAACCHATWNFFVKRVNGGPELIWLFSLLTVIIYLPVAIFVLLKERPDFGHSQIIFILGSAVLHIGYFLLLQRGYRYGDLSLVYPTARATGPILSTMLAVFLLGESVSWQIGIGALVIVVGVLFLTGGFKQRKEQVLSSLLFGIGAGVLIGSYTAWDAYAVTALAIPPVLLDYISSIGRTVILVPYARRHLETIRAHLNEHGLAVVCIAVFNPLAYILVLYALTIQRYRFPATEKCMSWILLAGSQ